MFQCEDLVGPKKLEKKGFILGQERDLATYMSVKAPVH